jgi:hypothetical protein
LSVVYATDGVVQWWLGRKLGHAVDESEHVSLACSLGFEQSTRAVDALSRSTLSPHKRWGLQEDRRKAEQEAKSEEQQTRTPFDAACTCTARGRRPLETSMAAANGRGVAFAGEFRAQLDEERNRRLGRGTNHAELRAEKRKRSKKDKKSKKVRDCIDPLRAVAAAVARAARVGRGHCSRGEPQVSGGSPKSLRRLTGGQDKKSKKEKKEKKDKVWTRFHALCREWRPGHTPSRGYGVHSRRAGLSGLRAGVRAWSAEAQEEEVQEGEEGRQ